MKRVRRVAHGRIWRRRPPAAASPAAGAGIHRLLRTSPRRRPLQSLLRVLRRGFPLAIFGFPISPPAASSQAPRFDALFFSLIGMSVIILVLIGFLLLYFSLRYRVSSKADRSEGHVSWHWKLEVGWIAGATVVGLVFFYLGAKDYLILGKPPPGAATYYVTGKQWMWEIQHPDGRREIDEMHIPVGQPIHLVISSEDVIHSFFVPAFRIKQDAVPGHYTSTWFRPTKIGSYHLFCAQYCGVNHARMVGTVYVMDRLEYEHWLAGEPQAPTAQPLTPPSETTFREWGCDQCHKVDTARLAPSLEGLYGARVELSDGRTVTADEEYIRESILDPAAKVVKGYPAIMPTYKGLINDDQLRMLVEAVKALQQDKPVKETRQ